MSKAKWITLNSIKAIADQIGKPKRETHLYQKPNQAKQHQKNKKK